MNDDLIKLTSCAKHQEVLREILECEECRKLRDSFADTLRNAFVRKIKTNLKEKIAERIRCGAKSQE